MASQNDREFTEATRQAELEKYNQERARSYNKNLYDIKHFEYPEGVGTKPDLKHFVGFYINIRDKSVSRFKYDTLPSDATNGVVVNRIGTGLTNQQASQALSAGAVWGAAITAGAVSGLAALRWASKRTASRVSAGKLSTAAAAGYKLTSVISAAAAGVAAAGAAAEFIQNAKVLKDNPLLPELKSYNFLRLKNAVALHVEDRPTVKYGVNYTDKDFGILAGLASSLGSTADTFSKVKRGAEALALSLAQNLKVPGSLGGATIADLAGFAAGAKLNPYREALFESIDYRTFSFKYRFFPKSLNETNNVRNIINIFKEHMHPELARGGFFYLYPSTFDIVYYYTDNTGVARENTYVHKIAPCVLTDMAVEYGGDTFSTFDNGAPTQINLTLTFRETDLLTKKEMRIGY